MCISVCSCLAEEPGGQSHVPVALGVSGSPCALEGELILYDRQMTTTFSSQVEKKTKPFTQSRPPRILQMHSGGQRWQYISLRLPCPVVLGIVFAAHAKSRRPHELNGLWRKFSKAPINYLQQPLDNYYFTRHLPVRPFGTSISDPQTIPLSCRKPLALK